MSSGGSFEITGLDEFERDLIKVISQKYPKEAKKFLQKQANAVRRLTRAKTPKDTGYTKKHWTVRTKGKKALSANSFESNVGNNAPLAHLLENGHSIANQYGKFGWVPGFHMLEKAVIAREPVFNDELKDFIRKTLEELEL